MLVLVLRALANGSPYPHWPVKISKCTVESQGSWPVCAIRQRQSGWERYRPSQLTKHTIMSQSGEMNPWKRHIILITKALASLFMTHVTGEQLCILWSHQTVSSQPSGGLTFAVLMDSPDQNRNMSCSSLSHSHSFHNHFPYYVTSDTSLTN